MALRNIPTALVAAALVSLAAAQGEAAREVPRYAHIFVIIEENKGLSQIAQHPDWTPRFGALAAEYGMASQFYAEVHPSEGNYVAMLGGDTFGIHDDDAFFCTPRLNNDFCEKSAASHYADHSISARSLMDQLTEKGLSWKAYMEDIPGAGSLVPRWPTRAYPVKGVSNELYAAKHNGFVNFKSVREEPMPAPMTRLVGFAQLDADLAADNTPNYAHIVPNQCNDMHGLGKDGGADVPADCTKKNLEGLIRRGDAELGMLVEKIMRAKVWSAPANTAIVVTFDENDDDQRTAGKQGCCGYEPDSAANFGGGQIPTIVITNHGPRHLVDPTPYNHYSLLRTTEAAFGITEFLRHASESDKGVVTMAPLFAAPTH